MFSIAVFHLIVAVAVTASATPTIFGNDDRKDMSELTDAETRELFRSVPVLVHEQFLERKATGFVLKTQPYGRKEALVASEPFYDQPAIRGSRYCTGFLVDSRHLLTAGHCVLDEYGASAPFMRLGKVLPCEKTRIVFDYAIAEDGGTPAPLNDIYQCSAVTAVDNPAGQEALSRYLEEHKPPEWDIGLAGTFPRIEDWALIELDRPVNDRAPLRLAPTLPQERRCVFAIGYPRALPAKLSGGMAFPSLFKDSLNTNLDAMAGNSGSPIFGCETKGVVGILVGSWSRDFTMRRGPFSKSRSIVWPEDWPAKSGIGTDATSIVTVCSMLPSHMRSLCAADAAGLGAEVEPLRTLPAAGHDLKPPAEALDNSDTLTGRWRNNVGSLNELSLWLQGEVAK